MVTATVTSTDTVTEDMHSGVHPWIVMDGHGYCDIHGLCDKGVYTVVSIHGWTGMVTATVTSMDTVTKGYAQWCPSLVPRLFGGGGKKSLVSTVCAYA